MRETVRKILRLNTPEDNRKLVLLVFINIGSSIVGLAGIASVMPFVALVSHPDSIFKKWYLSTVYYYLDFQSTHDFIIFMGIALFLVFVISNLVLAFSMWYNIGFTRQVSYNLSRSLLSYYLTQKYEFFLRRNSSDLVKNIFSEVGQVTNHIIKPWIELIAKGLLSVCIVIFLIIVSPGAAFLAVLLMGGLYAIIYLFIRRRVTKAGVKRVRTNKNRFSAANEVFGGIKDVKLLGKEQIYNDRFSKAAYKYESTLATVQVLSHLPRYFLEIVAFGGIILLVLALFIISGNIENILPLIALYTFAGYRLMPSLEAVFKSLTSMRGSDASLDLLYREIEEYRIQDNSSFSHNDNSRISFNDKVELNNIVFYYKGLDKAIINNVSLDIKANTTIGFVGHTGCGKTTTVDIILGLLKARSGDLLVDGIAITEDNLRGWQNQLGYVPQQIYLADDTITSNIAFGVPEKDIDIDAVKQAADIANIKTFIEEELPEKYNTVVGERGVRLSGGQKQRIGIARALYHDPSVLVFDEATSALDNITEAAVMEAIDNIMGTKTIIMIAHRISTVRKCDVIYYMDKGNIVAHGTYEELVNTCEEFRRVAGE